MLYFEDISEGDEFTAGPYQLTEEEIVSFSEKWDPFEFHTDQEAANSSILGGMSASGVHTVCIANRLNHDYESWAIQGAFGAEIRWPHPARRDDHLSLHRKVLSTRESKSQRLIESLAAMGPAVDATALPAFGHCLDIGHRRDPFTGAGGSRTNRTTDGPTNRRWERGR